MITEELLKKVESFAELQFSALEIAIILNDPDVFKSLEIEKQEMNDVEAALIRGRLRGEAEIRKAIQEQARSGSSSAQKQFLELVEKVKSE